MSTPQTPKKKFRIIKADYLLQAKVGRLEVTPEVIQKGKEAFENHQIDYTPYAIETLQALKTSIQALKDTPEERAKIESDIVARIMQVKANAPHFHYPLMGKLAHIMLQFLEELNDIDDHALEILEAHVRTLRLILQKKIQSPDSEIGKKLETELRAACTRYFTTQQKRS